MKLEREAGSSLSSDVPDHGLLAWVRFIKILLDSALRVQCGKEKPRNCADTWGERENWEQEVEENTKMAKRWESERGGGCGGDPQIEVQVYALSPLKPFQACPCLLPQELE